MRLITISVNKNTLNYVDSVTLDTKNLTIDKSDVLLCADHTESICFIFDDKPDENGKFKNIVPISFLTDDGNKMLYFKYYIEK